MELQGLGWDEGFAADFQPFAAEGFVPGRVTLEHQHIYTIHTGHSDLLATVSGSLRHRIVSRRDTRPLATGWCFARSWPAGGP